MLTATLWLRHAGTAQSRVGSKAATDHSKRGGGGAIVGPLGVDKNGGQSSPMSGSQFLPANPFFGTFFGSMPVKTCPALFQSHKIDSKPNTFSLTTCAAGRHGLQYEEAGGAGLLPGCWCS